MSWKEWCRLCGNYETISKIDIEIIELIKKLNTQITSEEVKMCVDCFDYLNDVNEFVRKTQTIQNMFLELENSEILKSSGNEDLIISHDTSNGYEKYLNDVRSNFGLDSSLDDTKGHEILESLFEESNIISDNSALEIKLENDMALQIDSLSTHDIDDVEKNEEDFEEDELDEDFCDTDVSSNIEQIDESKLCLNYNENEDELGDKLFETDEFLMMKKRRRKPLTSNEETIFEFSCHICKKEFVKMSQLSSHCRKIHECLPQVTCYCGKILSTWKRLLIHKQKHFPEKFNYECKECKMVYKLKASYLNHLKQKHGPDAKKFVCHQCARCFKDSRSLMAHEKTHLPDELKLIYPCDICQKKFVNKNSLKSHVTSVHEMASLYTCEQCGKSFSTKSNLKSHLYSHSNVKNVQCDICSARFKNMDSLRKHKKTHLEKSHKCAVCGNRYRNRNNLKAHMVCHSDAKPFKCTYCPNEYKRSKDLKCHMNLHSGERPYQCQFCARTFVNGSNCRKHKLKDHPDELAAFESVHGKGKGPQSCGFQQFSSIVVPAQISEAWQDLLI